MPADARSGGLARLVSPLSSLLCLQFLVGS
jgi:hypothetical protein